MLKSQETQPKCSSQASESEALHQGPLCLLFLWCPPADGWGLRVGLLCERFAKERAKVRVHVEGSGPVSLANNSPQEQQPVLRRGFLDTMFTRLWTSYPWYLVWFGRWWMNLHSKRSCCSTWVPGWSSRKIRETSRKIRETTQIICVEWPFADKGIQINHHIERGG